MCVSLLPDECGVDAYVLEQATTGTNLQLQATQLFTQHPTESTHTAAEGTEHQRVSTARAEAEGK